MQALCERRLKEERSKSGEAYHGFSKLRKNTFGYFSIKDQEQFVCYETYRTYLGEQS